MGDLAQHRAAVVERRARLHLARMADDPVQGRREAEREVAALVDPVLLEVPGGGHVCLADGGHGVLEVVDVLLADPAAAPAVRRRVLALARERGAAQVGVNRYPADPSTAAFADHPDFALSASNLLLDTDHAARSAVSLEPVDEATFARFVETTVADHAAQQVASGAAGTWEEHAAASRSGVAALLPEGRHSPGHHVWSVVADGGAGAVGWVWLAERSPRAGYVYDVRVDEAHRGRGLGRAAMDAAAAWCREQGLGVLGLNVFGHNAVARGLYDALGYRVVLDHLVATPR